jgi:hypothetical protein
MRAKLSGFAWLSPGRFFSKADARPAAVLIDEFYAGILESCLHPMEGLCVGGRNTFVSFHTLNGSAAHLRT